MDAKFFKKIIKNNIKINEILNDFWKRFLKQFGCILKGFWEAWDPKKHEKPLKGLQKSENH